MLEKNIPHFLSVGSTVAWNHPLAPFYAMSEDPEKMQNGAIRACISANGSALTFVPEAKELLRAVLSIGLESNAVTPFDYNWFRICSTYKNINIFSQTWLPKAVRVMLKEIEEISDIAPDLSPLLRLKKDIEEDAKRSPHQRSFRIQFNSPNFAENKSAMIAICKYPDIGVASFAEFFSNTWCTRELNEYPIISPRELFLNNFTVDDIFGSVLL